MNIGSLYSRSSRWRQWIVRVMSFRNMYGYVGLWSIGSDFKGSAVEKLEWWRTGWAEWKLSQNWVFAATGHKWTSRPKKEKATFGRLPHYLCTLLSFCRKFWNGLVNVIVRNLFLMVKKPHPAELYRQRCICGLTFCSFCSSNGIYKLANLQSWTTELKYRTTPFLSPKKHCWWTEERGKRARMLNNSSCRTSSPGSSQTSVIWRPSRAARNDLLKHHKRLFTRGHEV